MSNQFWTELNNSQAENIVGGGEYGVPNGDTGITFDVAPKPFGDETVITIVRPLFPVAREERPKNFPLYAQSPA